MTRTHPPDAGLTLVEVMIALAVIGVVTSVAVLGLGGAGRGMRVEAEAGRLAARLRLAADEAMITQQPIAISWDDRSYGFVTWDPRGRAWRAVSTPALGDRHTLPSGLRLGDDGADSPAQIGSDGAGRPIQLSLTGRAAQWAVTFDGLNVTSAPVGASL